MQVNFLAINQTQGAGRGRHLSWRDGAAKPAQEPPFLHMTGEGLQPTYSLLALRNGQQPNHFRKEKLSYPGQWESSTFQPVPCKSILPSSGERGVRESQGAGALLRPGRGEGSHAPPRGTEGEREGGLRAHTNKPLRGRVLSSSPLTSAGQAPPRLCVCGPYYLWEPRPGRYQGGSRGAPRRSQPGRRRLGAAAAAPLPAGRGSLQRLEAPALPLRGRPPPPTATQRSFVPRRPLRRRGAATGAAAGTGERRQKMSAGTGERRPQKMAASPARRHPRRCSCPSQTWQLPASGSAAHVAGLSPPLARERADWPKRAAPWAVIGWLPLRAAGSQVLPPSSSCLFRPPRGSAGWAPPRRRRWFRTGGARTRSWTCGKPPKSVGERGRQPQGRLGSEGDME